MIKEAYSDQENNIELHTEIPLGLSLNFISIKYFSVSDIKIVMNRESTKHFPVEYEYS